MLHKNLALKCAKGKWMNAPFESPTASFVSKSNSLSLPQKNK